MLVGFESQSQRDIEWVENSGKILVSSSQGREGGRDLLHSLLTHYSHSRASQALELGAGIVHALDGYIKMTGQWQDPVGKHINLRADGDGINCLLRDDPIAATTPLVLEQDQRPLTRAAKAFGRLFGGN
jgi:hypothetical protein